MYIFSHIVTIEEDLLYNALQQWFLTWGTCTPRGYKSLNMGVRDMLPSSVLYLQWGFTFHCEKVSDVFYYNWALASSSGKWPCNEV